MENKYIKRLAESKLLLKLNSSGCVLVSGPKFCGKSTMCERYAKSKVVLKTTNDIELANTNPIYMLKGNKPLLIDEWQKAPELWNLIKSDLDEDYQFGKYILTGSTTPINPKRIQHSGAGRIVKMILKPFSLYESNDSLGIVSLSKLFSKDYVFPVLSDKDNKVSLEDIAFYICRGGWPISIKANKNVSLEVTRNYYESLFNVENESDEFALFLKNKDIELLKTILKCYARNVSTQSSNTSMINDILESGVRKTLDEDTFLSYINVLKDLFIIYDMPSWNLNLRSSVSVRVSPTHHFIDTSIATSSLNINPLDLINDLKSFGMFFEDFAIRDLSIYADSINGVIKHYRDSSGQEVDAIIELSNSEYCAVEIKIASENNINLGIKSLKGFESKLKRNGSKLPKFMMILTSHGACYKKDNIYIVPINYLKP